MVVAELDSSTNPTRWPRLLGPARAPQGHVPTTNTSASTPTSPFALTGDGFHSWGERGKTPADCALDAPVDAKSILVNGTEPYLNPVRYGAALAAVGANRSEAGARAGLVQRELNLTGVFEQYINSTALDLSCNASLRQASLSPALPAAVLALTLYRWANSAR